MDTFLVQNAIADTMNWFLNSVTKTLLQRGLLEAEFYSDLTYKFKKKLVKLIFLISPKNHCTLQIYLDIT